MGGSLLRIQTLELTHFRGFGQLHFELQPDFTLIIGENGAGKTGVLEGLAAALDAWLSGFPEVTHRNILAEDLRRVRVERGGQVTLELAGKTVVTASGYVAGSPITWSRSRGSLKQRTSRGAAEVRALAERSAAQVSQGQAIDLPVISYHGTCRLCLSRQARQKERALPSLLNGYEGALEPASTHTRLEQWMAWREAIRLQNLDLKLPQGYTDPLVDAVKNAVIGCVPGAEYFYYSLAHQELRLRFTGGRELPLALLSDGYRGLVGLAAEVAWRAARLNPHYGADAAQKAQGVVLIDELDLHLHPRWQRQVVGLLTQTFPNIQWVATTHSPQVIASVKREQLRILRDGALVEARPYVEGRDTNSILEDVLGETARPQNQPQEKLDRLHRLLVAENYPEAQKLLLELESIWGPEDPALVGARWEVESGLAGASNVEV